MLLVVASNILCWCAMLWFWSNFNRSPVGKNTTGRQPPSASKSSCQNTKAAHLCVVYWDLHPQSWYRWSEMVTKRHTGLVVYQPLWKMMEFVSWDDYSQYTEKNVPNHQPAYILFPERDDVQISSTFKYPVFTRKSYYRTVWAEKSALYLFHCLARMKEKQTFIIIH